MVDQGWLRRAAVLCACGTLAAGCEAGGSSATTTGSCARPNLNGHQAIGDAVRFRGFPLFYVGDRFDGLPLTHVACERRAIVRAPVTFGVSANPGVMPSWGFIYGTCKGADAFDGSGCGPPVEVADDSSCWNNLALYSKRDQPPLVRLRGTPAGLFTDGAGSKVELYTKNTTITVFAENIAQARHVALELRSIDGRYGPGSRLPPATASTLAGKTRCRGADRAPT